jgi:hypothetical protein
MIALYRREYEIFDTFMQKSLGEESYKKWIVTKQMRIAVCQIVDTFL